MKKQIELCSKNIEYTLKLSVRARHLRLVIYHDGNFVVTAPHRMSGVLIEQFIRLKSQWILKKMQGMQTMPPAFRTRSAEEIYALKKQAQSFVENRIQYLNALYRFSFNKISIRNQKTRWGSCSKKGNLSFNYTIVLLPQQLADYIIVHELCHLAEFNHSQRFWDLVAQSVPNHREMRKQLRRSSMG